MGTTAGTVTLPVLVRFNDKDIEIGELTLDVKLIHGKVKAPTPREIKTALRRGLR
jgi:hypothetical protein